MTTADGAKNRQEERRQDNLIAAQIKREERDAAERRRLERLDDAEDRRLRRLKERADARDCRRAARAEALSALGERLAEHFVDLMFAPVIVVPGWLSWDAMSDFGYALYGGPGFALPVFSETAMWVFEFAIVRARRKDEHGAVWLLYVGMVASALFCAVLNFIHGLTGPIPGSITPGGEAGVVYALISVSGIITHQIVALGGRAQKATVKTAASEVAPAGRGPRVSRRPRTGGPRTRHPLPLVARLLGSRPRPLRRPVRRPRTDPVVLEARRRRRLTTAGMPASWNLPRCPEMTAGRVPRSAG